MIHLHFKKDQPFGCGGQASRATRSQHFASRYDESYHKQITYSSIDVLCTHCMETHTQNISGILVLLNLNKNLSHWHPKNSQCIQIYTILTLNTTGVTYSTHDQRYTHKLTLPSSGSLCAPGICWKCPTRKQKELFHNNTKTDPTI